VEDVQAGQSFNDAIIEFLKHVGVTNAFGVVGGPIASFIVALSDSGIPVFHFKHETGAGFAATEASINQKKPQLLFVTTGPGITNALTGILSAKSEGARLLVVTGYSPPRERGRFVSQDTSNHSFARAIFANEKIFDFSAVIEHEEDFALALARIDQGFNSPRGFVAHLALPASMQRSTLTQSVKLPSRAIAHAGITPETTKTCIDKLTSGSFVIWAGFGALSAWQEVRTLAEVSGAPLMCTPRAKGILPASHPQFLGMTGLGCDENIESYFEAHPVDHVLVLGSRLGEASSFWTQSYIPKKGFIHVDLDARAMSAAYPFANTLGIQAEIQNFLTTLLSQWPKNARQERSVAFRRERSDASSIDFQSTLVRPSVMMKVIQREVVDKTDVPILVDVGNAFSFSNRYLDFNEPGRYRVHFDFGAMGCASAGVLGTCIASRKKALAIVGDGAFLMQNEINTAVRYKLPCVWVVLNDARYGMVAQGLETLFGADRGSDFPPCNFVNLARSMGANGLRVECEADLGAALNAALKEEGPFIVDVLIDKRELAPSSKRFVSLARQGSQP